MNVAQGPLCSGCGAPSAGRFCGHCGAPIKNVDAAAWQARFLSIGARLDVTRIAVRDVHSLWTLLTEPFRHLDSIPRKTRRTMGIAALFGVVPLAVYALVNNPNDEYWSLAIYFSLLWAGFFGVVYHSRGARPQIAVAMYFGGIAAIGVASLVLGLGFENLRDPFVYSADPVVSLFGYVFGVGAFEEFMKILPLIGLSLVMKLPPLRLFIYYALIAGLGFGFHEAIIYQNGQNVTDAIGAIKSAMSATDQTQALNALVQALTTAANTPDQITALQPLIQAFQGYYLENVLRLTSAPFFHAVWTGTAAFLIWFGLRFPARRPAFFFLAIAVPATLHGLYDFFSGSQPLAQVLVGIVSVALLCVYIGYADRLERELEVELKVEMEIAPA